MGGNRFSSMARLTVGVIYVSVLLALSVATRQTLSGQSQREWRDYAGGPDSSRFVAATQITKANVQPAPGRRGRTRPARPTSIRSSCAASSTAAAPNGSFVALDAATGQAALDPRRRPGLQQARRELLGEQGRQRPPADFQHENFLQEIDAHTGRADLRRSARTAGSTCAWASIGIRRRSTSRAALPGRVFENLLILGSATNQEYASAPGDIRAFDVRTGALVWTFHTVPRPGEFGYDTWPTDAWKTVGGANNWGEQSIDEKRGIVYIPTGSPKYNFYGGNRKGANLFGDCIIALDARTGKRLWHFQTVHHDIWDLDNNSAPQLTTIRRERPRRSTSSPWRARPATCTSSIA